MNRALEIFSRTPKTHNCAQAVAAGCGYEELVPSLAAMGHGKAPGGRCGALHAALAATPETFHAGICRDFVVHAGSELCKELKQNRVSCEACVELAASLLENCASVLSGEKLQQGH